MQYHVITEIHCDQCILDHITVLTTIDMLYSIRYWNSTLVKYLTFAITVKFQRIIISDAEVEFWKWLRAKGLYPYWDTVS